MPSQIPSASAITNLLGNHHRENEETSPRCLQNAVNWIIDKWNNFRLSFKLPGILGGGTISLDTPNIPRLHSGGVFGAPRAGEEGLAILRDRERIPPATGNGGGAVVQILPVFVGSTSPLAAEIDRMLTKRSRTLGPGF